MLKLQKKKIITFQMVDQYLYGKDNGALFYLWKSRKQAETIIITIVYIKQRFYH